MSVLTKKEILKYIQKSNLVFNPPLDKFQIQPHAVDLRLGFDFFIPKKWILESEGRKSLNIDYLEDKDLKSFDEISLNQGQYFEMLPNETIIAKTLEKISINHPSIMAVLYPRSSINRKGLAVDLSGIIDTNYSGYLIIPLKNNTSQVIKLYPGERICQLVFQYLTSELSPSEAKMHGITDAKYSHSESHFYSIDKDLEIDYIRKGQTDLLKTEHSISEEKNLTLNIQTKQSEKKKGLNMIDYPYLPEGKTLKYVSLENTFMTEAKNLLKTSGCTKQPTGAVIVIDDKIIGKGCNAGIKVEPCPRVLAGYKTGEGYHLCKEICQQEGHAEVMAVKDAKTNTQNLKGADIYLFGHWWCCKDCWDIMIKEGIENVYLVENATEMFTQ